MQLIKAVVLLALCGSAAASSDGHPVEKIITMLKGLSVKIEAEGKTEAIAYDKFEHWCATSKKALDYAIAEEKETIAQLESQIQSEELQIETLNKEIADLEKQIEEMAAAQKAAEEMRAEGRDLYAKTDTDLKSTIAAMKECLVALDDSKAAGPSFVQQALSKPAIRQALALASFGETKVANSASALLQQLGEPIGAEPAPAEGRPDLIAKGDDAAHVQQYDFKSGSVIELLKGLLTKFEDESVAATKAETAAENAYALETQARKAATDAATKSKDEKTSVLGDVMQDLATHQGELKSEQDELAADTESLQQTEAACAMKAQEWETRSTTRSKELEAMGMAVEILSKSTGVRSEAPSNPVPPPSPLEASEPASFLQIASTDPRQRAINLLRERAQSSHSKKLAKMAQELASHADDTFAEVNNMIEKMIFRLMNEQTDEDNHKLWCDEELSKTNTSKVNKEEKIAELTMKIDKAAATIQELMSRITECNDMVAQLTTFARESEEIRDIGKKENAEALEDAQDAQTAVTNAIAVLEAFYKDSGMVKKEAWELVQKGVELPESPATWGAGYTGVADPNNQPSGIVAVMEAVSSDFAQMEAQTRAQEEQDQKEFEESMKATAIEKADRQKEAEMKEAEMKRTTDKMESNKKIRKETAAQLEAVEQYLKDLAPACLDGDSSYEERKAARQTEIDALKEAEQILANAFAEKPSGSFLAVRRH